MALNTTFGVPQGRGVRGGEATHSTGVVQHARRTRRKAHTGHDDHMADTSCLLCVTSHVSGMPLSHHALIATQLPHHTPTHPVFPQVRSSQ